jgi:putative cell wall-binding protein
LRRIAAALALICLVAIGLVPATSAAAATARFGGADRLEVAIGISQQFEPGVPVVYVAKSGDYPDALSAAPAAALGQGPLLLTPTGSLPSSVGAEIARLQPKRIVVVGGPASVAPAVYDQLAGLAPSIERISGADRYEASRALVTSVFSGAPVSRVYITTGANFPDALAAGAAAGSLGVPVLLVNGSASTLDAPTRALLSSLAPAQIVVAGGPASVSTGIEADLGTLGAAGGVLRLSGADRYEAALAISSEAFPAATAAYIATGTNFPDALTGAALAGRNHSPLLLVTPPCAPQSVVDHVSASGITDVTAFGGPSSVSDAALAMTACVPFQQPTASPSYNCSAGLQYSISNPNHTEVVVTVSADDNGDGVLDRTIQSVKIAGGSSYVNYGAGIIPEGRATTIAFHTNDVIFSSTVITPHCISAFPTASASYNCNSGLQYAIQNPNEAAVTVVVSTDENGDGVLDRTVQTVSVPAKGSYANYGAGGLPEDRTTNVVFHMNEQTFYSKLIAVDCVAAPPSPVQQWANSTFGWFAPESKSGYGDGFYNMPAGARGGAVTLTYQGGSNFVVWALDASNNKVSLLVNEIGSYSGTVAWGVSDYSTGAVKLQITASGPWTASFKPISSLPGVQSNNTGSDVFLYTGGPAGLNLYYPGSNGNFIVWETQTGRYSRLDSELLVNEIGFYSGSVPLRSGYSVVEVTADGPWAASIG